MKVEGHNATVSQTNSWGFVALCECGWISEVVARRIVRPREDSSPTSRLRFLAPRIRITDTCAQSRATTFPCSVREVPA